MIGMAFIRECKIMGQIKFFIGGGLFYGKARLCFFNEWKFSCLLLQKNNKKTRVFFCKSPDKPYLTNKSQAWGGGIRKGVSAF